jgi:hypothetical protein
MSSAVVSWIVDGVASAIALIAMFIALRAAPKARKQAHDDIVVQLVTPGSELRTLVRNVAWSVAQDRFAQLAKAAGLSYEEPLTPDAAPIEHGRQDSGGLDYRVSEMERKLDQALGRGRNHLGN